MLGSFESTQTRSFFARKFPRLTRMYSQARSPRPSMGSRIRRMFKRSSSSRGAAGSSSEDDRRPAVDLSHLGISSSGRMSIGAITSSARDRGDSMAGLGIDSRTGLMSFGPPAASPAPAVPSVARDVARSGIRSGALNPLDDSGMGGTYLDLIQ